MFANLDIAFVLTLATAGIGGFFLAFSDLIMRSLSAGNEQANLETMQRINVDVYRTIFMVLFVALTLASVLVLLMAFFGVFGRGHLSMTMGALTYLVGVFGITGFGNVPMNEKLKNMHSTLAPSQAYWRTYLSHWTRWNHVRSLACFLSAACYASAIGQLGA